LKPVAVFWGCRIQTFQYAYELSLRNTLPKLDVELVDLRNTNCCGDPVKSVNNFASLYLASRVLALASETGLKDLLVPCNRCHLTLSETRFVLEKEKTLKEKINAFLSEEGLTYSSDIKLWHTIDFLYEAVGIEKIRKTIEKTLNDLKIATHIGCQIIRPSEIGRVDNSEIPKKLDELVQALGAQTIEYPEKLDCCGAMLLFSHPDAALSLAGSKLKALQEHNVDALIDSCAAGHGILDAKQESAGTAVGGKLNLPVLYYTQLLGIAMNIEYEKLGLHLNQSPVNQFLEKINRA
jgi:heterodisulfide reductase subunit B